MKIFCIGRNYSEHAKELQNEIPEESVIFMKPETAILSDTTFYLPEFSNDIHYEVELVLKINKMGKYIQKEFAQEYFDEVALGIDFTARDIQQELKSKGLPWEKAKAFDQSAVVGNFVSKSTLDINNCTFSLEKNGETVQKGNTSYMLFDIDELIVQISKYFSIKKGDLIYTGTPSGVGPVKEGDTLKGFLEGKENFQVFIE